MSDITVVDLENLLIRLFIAAEVHRHKIVLNTTLSDKEMKVLEHFCNDPYPLTNPTHDSTNR
jgi:hypothetical protein